MLRHRGRVCVLLETCASERELPTGTVVMAKNVWPMCVSDVCFDLYDGVWYDCVWLLHDGVSVICVVGIPMMVCGVLVGCCAKKDSLDSPFTSLDS